MASLKHVTREKLLAAMTEYDELGPEAFHEKHGTNAQVTKRGGRGGYVLEHEGKQYPSKAVVAAAAGYTPGQFSGGPAALGSVLKRAGLALVQLCLTAVVAATVVVAPARVDARALLRMPAASGQVAAYFASGANQPANIRGFAAIGHAVGVAAEEVSEAGENALYQLAGTGVHVFVDTSAFKEVRFPNGVPTVVYPITHDQWRTRLDMMSRLAAVLGPQVHLVAPDMVGFQDVTLQRLERYRRYIESWRSCGAGVLVPIQKGQLTQVAFDVAVSSLLGERWYVPALPMSKAATTVDEARVYAHSRRPDRLHLLGMGPRSRSFDCVMQAVAFGRADTVVTCDSNLLLQSVGHTNGRANHPAEELGGPRVLTQARGEAARLITAGLSRITSLPELAIRLAFGPSPNVQLALV